MAKLVEICGVAGVGKSTVFKNMVMQWQKAASWIPSTFLYPQEKLKFDSVSKLLLSMEKKFSAGEGNIDERIICRYGDEFVARHPQFIDACWSNLCSGNYKSKSGRDLRFDKTRYLYKTLGRFEYLQDYKTSKTVVMDEGITHRVANGLFRRETAEEEEQEIAELIKWMPLPAAVLYLEAAPEEVARRLYHRKKIITAHASLNLSELKKATQIAMSRMEQIMKSLEQRGVPVLRLNASEPASGTATQALGFLENTLAAKPAAITSVPA